MGLAAVFESKKLLAIIAVAIIAVGLFADFITTVVWFSRINPYFSHGKSKAKQTHGGTAACFVFSLIALLAIIALVVLALFVKPLFEKVSENNLLSLVCIAVIGALCVGNVIAGIVAAAPAVTNKKEIDEDWVEDEETGEWRPVYTKVDVACYLAYELDMDEIYSYYCHDDKSRSLQSQKKGKNLSSALLKKRQLANNPMSSLSKNHHSKAAILTSLKKETKGDSEYVGPCGDYVKHATENFLNKDGRYLSSKVCGAVGIPTIIFSVIEIIGIILFLIVAIPNLNSDGGNKSANENA